MLTLLLLLALPALLYGGNRKTPSLAIEKVPVKGTVDRFLRRLYSAGFYVEGIYNDETVLVGTWEGFRGAHLRVHGDGGGMITDVVVLLDANDDWVDIRDRYCDVIKVLSGKWGEPARTAFLFDGQDGGFVNDTAKMLRLIRGLADVHSAWNLKDGGVRTSVRYDGGKYYIVTEYTPQLFY